MPIHEYRCQKCKHRFEILQKMNDKPAQACPKCGGPVKKLISSPAIQFKGTGFYITDYAHKNSPSGEEKPRAPKTEKKTEPPKKDAPAASAE
jgi:putative FmdB family regulatory protein